MGHPELVSGLALPQFRNLRKWLVERDGLIDAAGPGVYAAGERLGVLEALVAEPHGDGKRTLSVMTEDDDGLVGIEFGVGAGGDVPHGHQERSGKAGGLGLPGLSDIEQNGGLGGIALLQIGLGGNLWIEHSAKDTSGVAVVPAPEKGFQTQARGIPVKLEGIWMPKGIFRGALRTLISDACQYTY